MYTSVSSRYARPHSGIAFLDRRIGACHVTYEFIGYARESECEPMGLAVWLHSELLLQHLTGLAVMLVQTQAWLSSIAGMAYLCRYTVSKGVLGD